MQARQIYKNPCKLFQVKDLDQAIELWERMIVPKIYGRDMLQSLGINLTRLMKALENLSCNHHLLTITRNLG